MSKVTLTTELPIPAKVARDLAAKPEFLRYVLWPIVQMRFGSFPDLVEVGTCGSARLWFFGIIPGWTHHLTIKALDPTEIYTNERGGPVHTWNHRLTFDAIDENRCRYTDDVETDDGWSSLPTRGVHPPDVPLPPSPLAHAGASLGLAGKTGESG